MEKRDSKTSTYLFRFADALSVNPRWLQDGEGLSGLEDPRTEAESRLLEQLIGLWTQLSVDNRDAVISVANSLHAKDHPLASTSNPFGKKREESQQRAPAGSAKGVRA